MLKPLKTQKPPLTNETKSFIFATRIFDIAYSFKEKFSPTFNSRSYPSRTPLCQCATFPEDKFETITYDLFFVKLVAMKPSGDVLYENFAFSLLLVLTPDMRATFVFIILFYYPHDNIPWYLEVCLLYATALSQIVKPRSNCKPIRLLSIVSLIFDENIFQFSYNKMKGKIIPREFGFQPRKVRLYNWLIFWRRSALKTLPKFIYFS